MILNNFLITKLLTFCDVPQSYQFGIQDPATPMLIGMISFHDYLLLFMIAIGVAVCYILMYIIINYRSKANPYEKIIKFSHSSILEIIWTIIPAIILLFLAIPSFNLLYSLDEIINPKFTLKIIGHQWYWSYEYSDQGTNKNGGVLNFDSYIVLLRDFHTRGLFRLLEVDNRMVIPSRTHIRLLVTAADVLHSWAVPALGIKIDACPGRLSQVSLYVKRSGVFYGQCSEICGVNHGFMPISIRSCEADRFVLWLIAALADPKKVLLES